ncbi:MAG: hypothetical protein KC445_13765 [Anaerolineales bacterium]|nr:hypothetical protein [Anaerolineales bacterium]
MKPLKLSLYFLLLLPLLALFMTSQQATAQTDPNATPEGGYPPPTTVPQDEEGYPLQRPTTIAPENEPGYVAPTAVPQVTNPPTVVGDGGTETTPEKTLPISQSELVTNRLILWAGFLVTLFIFGLAVYGAIIMYTRSRK